jgi:hypothetical protein
MDNQLSKEQQDYKTYQLDAGLSYEEMTKTKGWENTQIWYQTQLNDFVNQMMAQEKTPINEFETGRQQLIGFKRFMNHMNGAINLLNDERAKEHTGPTE